MGAQMMLAVWLVTGMVIGIRFLRTAVKRDAVTLPVAQVVVRGARSPIALPSRRVRTRVGLGVTMLVQCGMALFDSVLTTLAS